MKNIVLAALLDRRSVLLGRRAKHKRHYPGHWDLIGGHVEDGESLESAVGRELWEEIGVRPTALRLLGSFISDGASVSYHVYAVTSWLNGSPTLHGDEHTELCWVPLECTELIRPFAHSEVMNVLRRI